VCGLGAARGEMVVVGGGGGCTCEGDELLPVRQGLQGLGEAFDVTEWCAALEPATAGKRRGS
jgi:hypothetical protein